MNFEDGRLPEEEPQRLWNPRGGERVAHSAREADREPPEAKMSPEPSYGPEELERQRKGDLAAAKVLEMAGPHTRPGQPLIDRLTSSVDYLGSDQFLRDLFPDVEFDDEN